MASKIHLLSLRSRRCERIAKFLEQQARSLDRSVWSRASDGQPLVPSEMQVDLSIESKTARAEMPQKREVFSAIAQETMPIQRLQHFDPGSDSLLRQAQMHHFTADQGDSVDLWSQTFGAERLLLRYGFHVQAKADQTDTVMERRLVTGEPGSGKSFCSRGLIAELCRLIVAYLAEGKILPQEAPRPLWMTATHFAGCGGEPWQEAITEGQPTLEPAINEDVRQWLLDVSGSWIVVLDSLDELTDARHLDFSDQLATVNGRGLIIFTCRAHQWQTGSLAALIPGTVQRLELKPMALRQQREFAEHFFARTEQAESFVGLLRTNPPLAHSLSSPLLCLFACQAASILTHKTRPAQLYHEVVHAMLEGRWLTQHARAEVASLPWPPRSGGGTEIDDAADWLRHIAWGIFRRSPESNLFTRDVWHLAIRDAAAALPHLALPTYDGSQFLKTLRRLGVIVYSGRVKGVDDLLTQGYSFSHRQLLEFLAGWSLASQTEGHHETGEPIWLWQTKQWLWYCPEFRGCLLSCVGCVPDPRPLMASVDAELNSEADDLGDDLFYSMLNLRLELAVACPHISDGTESLAQMVAGVWLATKSQHIFCAQNCFADRVIAIASMHWGISTLVNKAVQSPICGKLQSENDNSKNGHNDPQDACIAEQLETLLTSDQFAPGVIGHLIKPRTHQAISKRTFDALCTALDRSREQSMQTPDDDGRFWNVHGTAMDFLAGLPLLAQFGNLALPHLEPFGEFPIRPVRLLTALVKWRILPNPEGIRRAIATELQTRLPRVSGDPWTRTVLFLVWKNFQLLSSILGLGQEVLILAKDAFLNESNNFQQRDAGEILLRLAPSHPEAAQFLINLGWEALADEIADTRGRTSAGQLNCKYWTFEQIAELGAQATDLLTAALRSKDASLQQIAAVKLSNIRHAFCAQDLDLLLASDDQVVRSVGIVSSGFTIDARDRLQAIMTSSVAAEREAAAKGLAIWVAQNYRAMNPERRRYLKVTSPPVGRIARRPSGDTE